MDRCPSRTSMGREFLHKRWIDNRKISPNYTPDTFDAFLCGLQLEHGWSWKFPRRWQKMAKKVLLYANRR